MKKFRYANYGAVESRRKHRLTQITRWSRRHDHPRRRPGCSLGTTCALIGGVLVLSITVASAAEPATENPLQPLVDGLAGKYGWITTVILVIGCLRVLFKPVMLAIESYVKQTPGEADDARIAKFEGSSLYQAIAFVLDFGASIKLPLVAPSTKPEDKP
jgi:hypothetical protein